MVDLVINIIFAGGFFLCWDWLFIKTFKLKEIPSILIAFIIVAGFYILDIISLVKEAKSHNLTELDIEHLGRMVFMLLFSIIWLVVFLFMIKRDKAKKEKLKALDDNTMLEIDKLADLSNLSKRRIKYYSYLGVLPYSENEKGELLYVKGDTIERLKKIEKLKKQNVKANDLVNHFK